MTRITRSLLLLGALLTTLPAADHPRLLFGAGELPLLRGRRAQEPYASMLNRMIAIAQRSGTQWQQSESAMNCAFLYAITGEDAWALRAKGYVEQRLNDTVQPWAVSTKGLNLYFHGKAVAIAYDLCHDAPSWSSFRSTVSKKLLAQAEFIYGNGGTEQNTNPASNWQANRYASAGLCYLATDESFAEANLTACFAKVNAYLASNMGTGSGNRGWNAEGRGYTTYPWGHIGPYAIAAKRLRNQDIRAATPDAVDFALWTVYAGSARIVGATGGQYAIHPDFGDDDPNGGSIGEGCYGLAFRFCPPALHPGLVHWYDRLKGSNGDGTWDSFRGGTIYSYLFHPGTTVSPADPLGIPAWRGAFADTVGNGMFVFRNRYQTADDLISEVYVKLRGDRGHNGPDALGFRIVGHDTIWATGGGRYGTRDAMNVDPYWRSQNSLYAVDPSTGAFSVNGNSGTIVGTPAQHAQGGGTMVASIATSNVGVSNHTRRFLADHTASGADGAWVISDTSDNGRFWQLCTLEVNTIVTAGNTFTISAPNGATLRGTVLHPAAPKFTVGIRARGSAAGWHGKTYANNRFVSFESQDGDHLVVLTAVPAGRAHPAVATTAGSGAATGRILSIGSLQVQISGDAITTGGANRPPTVGAAVAHPPTLVLP